jgi:hypothetical protein
VDGDVLRAVLLERPKGVSSERTIVFTATPERWSKEDSSLEIVAVAPTHGASSALEQNVVEQLLSAGWHEDSIVLRYRTGLKAVAEFDVAVFHGGSAVLAIDVRGRPNDGSHMAALIRASNGLRFVCESDGTSYQLFDANHFRVRTLDRAPSPSDLGLAIEHSALSSTAIANISADVMQRALRPGRRVSAVLDISLPIGLKIDAFGGLSWLKDAVIDD